MQTQKMSRRTMLRLSGITAAATWLVACAAAAPAGDTADSANAGAAPVEVSLVECWFGVPQVPETMEAMAQVISQRMQDSGQNIEFKSLILDDRVNKYPVLYASGEKFTIAFDAPWVQMVNLIEQDYLLPIQDLVAQHGPNITELVGDDILNANYMNGALYGIPAYFYYHQTSGPEIREDLRLKYGAPEPTDEWSSLEPYLEAIKQNEPDMVPYLINPTTDFGFGTGFLSLHSSAVNPGNRMVGSWVTDVWENRVYTDSETMQVVQENIETVRRWAEKGYINQSVIEGDLFVAGGAAARTNNEPDFKYWDSEKAVAKNVPGAQVSGWDMSGMRSGKVKRDRRLLQWNFIVTNKAAPEEAQIAGIQMFDWIMSNQDNIDLWLFGEAGKNYQAGEGLTYTEIEGVDPARNYRRTWYVGGMAGKRQRIAADTPEKARATLEFLSNPDNFLPNPMEGFQPDIKPVEAQLAALRAADGEAKFPMLSGQDAAEVTLKFYQETLDAAGRQEVKAVFQEQLDAWVAANVKE
jgi:putative aldouronate transport system substrate-binding protein